MVELTYGGTWVKWRSLGPGDKSWALLSIVTTFLAALPVGVITGRWGYSIGYRLGSGGREPRVDDLNALIASDLFAYAILASAVLGLVAAFAWWRFSRNQDEMFNRIQNYAIGQAGGWTFAIALLWWVLSLGGWLEPLPLATIVLIGTALLIGFWFYAVRRWL